MTQGQLSQISLNKSISILNSLPNFKTIRCRWISTKHHRRKKCWRSTWKTISSTLMILNLSNRLKVHKNKWKDHHRIILLSLFTLQIHQLMEKVELHRYSMHKNNSNNYSIFKKQHIFFIRNKESIENWSIRLKVLMKIMKIFLLWINRMWLDRLRNQYRRRLFS